MELVNKTTVKIAADKGIKMVKNSKPSVNLAKKVRLAVKNTAGDVAEFSNKTSMRVLTNADIAKIKQLRKEGFTQVEIARTFGVGRHVIQQFLYQHLPDAANDRTGIMQALKDYFLASSKKTKSNAFLTIDKYIEKLAKEDATTNGYAFEDYFQDLRLRFLEFAKARKNKDKVCPNSFFSALLYRPQTNSVKKSKTVPLNYLSNTAKEAVPFDSGIAKFETDNLREFLLEKDVDIWRYNPRCVSNLKSQAIMISYIKNGKSIDEIADRFGLTKSRIQDLIRNAIKTLEKKYNFVASGENYKERAKIYQSIVNSIEKSI